MAGYSGTPLAKKLGVKEGAKLLLIGGPVGLEESLAPLPAGVSVSRNTAGKAVGKSTGAAAFDVIVLFARDRAALAVQFETARARLVENGGLWVAWPKKASGVATDLTENVIREFGLESGLVDNKVCAVDEVWSGLRFVVRLKDRTKR